MLHQMALKRVRVTKHTQTHTVKPAGRVSRKVQVVPWWPAVQYVARLCRPGLGRKARPGGRRRGAAGPSVAPGRRITVVRPAASPSRCRTLYNSAKQTPSHSNPLLSGGSSKTFVPSQTNTPPAMKRLPVTPGQGTALGARLDCIVAVPGSNHRTTKDKAPYWVQY